jgi:hypothetical protein
MKPLRFIARGCTTLVGQCVISINTPPEKPTKKITAVAGFIRCHSWRLPSGPAEAVQIFSIKICGKDGLNPKRYWMNQLF